MYLSPATMPRILAHRGQPKGENTIPAFESALNAGADYIETDIQCSKDGVAVVFHDGTLLRIAGLNRKVSKLSFAELKALNIGISSLEQVLSHFSSVSFNIDFKSSLAIEPGIAAIRRTGATQRVLATSFSELRLRKVHKLAPELERSLSGIRVFLCFIFGFLIRPLSRGFVAAQIPVSWGGLKLAGTRFVSALKRAGLEVHFWVINDLEQVDHLLKIGADGFVTDETAKLVAHLRKA